MAIPPQPDCILRGALVEIAPLRPADLVEMRAWEPHQDPLLRDYNVSYETDGEWHSWLRNRLRHRWAYAIRIHEGALVGHLSLRQLELPHSSRLGLSIAAAHVNLGYGQDALHVFLDYYFDVLGFDQIRLDVSGANPRARHVYQKLGFQEVAAFWREAPWGAKPTPATRRFFRWGRIRHFEMRLKSIQWRRFGPDPE
jgi:RimJ/RimL family protein N-acetyltransferase